jgi:hypothetical protein
VRHAIAQADPLQSLCRLNVALLALHTRIDQRHFDVGQRRHARQQVERLEDEADLVITDTREFLVGHLRYALPVQLVFAGCRPVQAAQDVHERRLARTRLSHDREVLVLEYVQVNRAQGVDEAAAHDIPALQVPQVDDRVLVQRSGAVSAR